MYPSLPLYFRCFLTTLLISVEVLNTYDGHCQISEQWKISLFFSHQISHHVILPQLCRGRRWKHVSCGRQPYLWRAGKCVFINQPSTKTIILFWLRILDIGKAADNTYKHVCILGTCPRWSWFDRHSGDMQSRQPENQTHCWDSSPLVQPSFWW